jgi:hypothetical protein
MDAYGKLLATGQVGEIVLRGEQIMPGYLFVTDIPRGATGKLQRIGMAKRLEASQLLRSRADERRSQRTPRLSFNAPT